MSTQQNNCFNPGWELSFAPKQPCMKEQCKKTYYDCMYNTQGQYVCPKQKESSDGWDFIMTNGNSHVIHRPADK
jgi:hypothetical protein